MYSKCSLRFPSQDGCCPGCRTTRTVKVSCNDLTQKKTTKKKTGQIWTRLCQLIRQSWFHLSASRGSAAGWGLPQGTDGLQATPTHVGVAEPRAGGGSDRVRSDCWAGSGVCVTLLFPSACLCLLPSCWPGSVSEANWLFSFLQISINNEYADELQSRFFPADICWSRSRKAVMNERTVPFLFFLPWRQECCFLMSFGEISSIQHVNLTLCKKKNKRSNEWRSRMRNSKACKSKRVKRKLD